MTFRLGKTARLIRALQQHAASHGVELTPLAITERPWASATFDGVALAIRCALAEDAAEDAAGNLEADAARVWLTALPDAELPLRGAFVADVSIAHVDAGDVTLAVLLIDAP